MVIKLYRLTNVAQFWWAWLHLRHFMPKDFHLWMAQKELCQLCAPFSECANMQTLSFLTKKISSDNLFIKPTCHRDEEKCSCMN